MSAVSSRGGSIPGRCSPRHTAPALRPDPVEVHHHLGAAATRQYDIHDDEVDGSGVSLCYLDRGVAVTRLEHGVPVRAEPARCRAQNRGLVFHDEDGLLAVRRLQRAIAWSDLRRSSHPGQIDGEPGSFPNRALHRDRTAVTADGAVDRRQAEPGAPAQSLVVKNGSKIRACVAGSMPAPVSVTRSATYGPGSTAPSSGSDVPAGISAATASSVIVPVSVMASRAFTIRLTRACSI